MFSLSPNATQIHGGIERSDFHELLVAVELSKHPTVTLGVIGAWRGDGLDHMNVTRVIAVGARLKSCVRSESRRDFTSIHCGFGYSLSVAPTLPVHCPHASYYFFVLFTLRQGTMAKDKSEKKEKKAKKEVIELATETAADVEMVDVEASKVRVKPGQI